MERKIVINVVGGVAHLVVCEDDVRVEIRDYDIEGCDDDVIKKGYTEVIYPATKTDPAPELLEACNTILNRFGGHVRDYEEMTAGQKLAIERTVEAIRKAEGKN